MKKILFTIIIIFVITTTFAQKAEAHFLAMDKNIGAVLHVDPDDDPIAGEQASFFFEFKDIQNKFDPKNCDCTFTITENGNIVYAQPLFQNSDKPSLTNASVFYTFPQKDVYVVKVVGNPLTPKAFQPFTLTWNFRVDQIASAQTTSDTHNHSFFSTHLVHFIGAGVFILLFIIYIVYTKLHKTKTVVKGGEKQDDKKDISDRY